MKTLITATAVLMLFASAASAQDRTQEYRMWSAERMIERLAVIIGNNPSIINSIRAAATSGNEVLWAETVDVVHQLELDTARAENKAAHEQRQANDEQKRLKSDLRRARQYFEDWRR